MHKWLLIIYFCTVYIGIQIQALHRIKQNDSISDSRNHSMIVNDFVRIRDSEVLNLTNVSFTNITKLSNIDSHSVTNHLNTSSSKTPVEFKDDIRNHLSSKPLKAFPHHYMNYQLKPSVNTHSLQLPNSTKTKKQTKVSQIPKQEMKYHNNKSINRNILPININGNIKNYAFNNTNGQNNNNNINDENSNIEYNIKTKIDNQKTIDIGISDNYIQLNKIQNNSYARSVFDGNKNNNSVEGTCINNRQDDNTNHSKLSNLSDNNHRSKQQSLQPRIDKNIIKFNKQQVQPAQQIYPQDTKSIQKQCQEKKDKFTPIENILRFANMLLYKVNSDAPVYSQGRQFINYPIMNHNLNKPIKKLNSPPSIINVQSKSNLTDTNIDSIDYLYNTMDSLPYLNTLTGVTGTSTNINRPVILQSHMGGNDLRQSFNMFEDALDMLLNADEDDDVIELRCPVHHEIKNAGEYSNNAVGNEEKNRLMQVCSCRLVKKKEIVELK